VRQLLSPPTAQPVGLWRYGQPEPEGLRAFLLEARQHLPPDDPVVFASAATSGDDEFFRYLWASYFLADRTVVPSFDARAERLGESLVAYQRAVDGARWEIVWEVDAGAVSRRSDRPLAGELR